MGKIKPTKRQRELKPRWQEELAHPHLTLTGADRDVFLAALLEPPAPTPKLVAALKRRR